MNIRIDEALRYLGVRSDPDGSLRAQMSELAAVLSCRCTPRWVWRVLPIDRSGGTLALGGSAIVLPGRSAERMLAQCHQAVVMACTLGSAFDAWVQQAQRRDMRTAVMLDALGSACVEAACNAAEQEIAGRFPGLYMTDRFSPGYGDLPLDVQPVLLQAIDAQRRIGVSLTPACLMQPQKSVTAVIGLADTPQMARIRGCAFCSLQKCCTLRKAGKTCS